MCVIFFYLTDTGESLRSRGFDYDSARRAKYKETFFLSWVANTELNHWTKAEREHSHFACPNFY